MPDEDGGVSAWSRTRKLEIHMDGNVYRPSAATVRFDYFSNGVAG